LGSGCEISEETLASGEGSRSQSLRSTEVGQGLSYGWFRGKHGAQNPGVESLPKVSAALREGRNNTSRAKGREAGRWKREEENERDREGSGVSV